MKRVPSELEQLRRRAGRSAWALWYRLHILGWTPEQALATPPLHGGQGTRAKPLDQAEAVRRVRELRGPSEYERWLAHATPRVA